MRRSEAPAGIELCAETGADLVVATILSVTIRSDMGWLLPNPVWLRRRSVADEFDGFVRFFRTFSLLRLMVRVYWHRVPLTRPAAQTQVQRAFAAVAEMCFLETDDKAAELRQRQP